MILKLRSTQLLSWGSKNNFLYNHVFVILLFVILTGIFTYPSYLEFDKLLGHHGDQDFDLNTFWWYNYNVKNNKFGDTSWLFYHEYQFYPEGVPLTAEVNFNTLISIPLMPIVGNPVHLYNLLVYSTFILAGYGNFLLVRHITKNYYAAIIAGIIFSFGIYHIVESWGHLAQSTVQFIPFTVLFLIKSAESNNVKNPIIGGAFLFLTLISAYYLAFFTLFFLVSFLLYLVIKKQNFQTFLRIGLLFTICAIFTSIIYYGNYAAIHGSVFPGGRGDVGDYVFYSADITNYFIPTQFHFISQFFNFPTNNQSGGYYFLGYTVLFLMLLGLIKKKSETKKLWIISGLILGLVSLGPMLKFNGHNTGIVLPYYFLYDLPIFNFFRTISISTVYVTFSVSILAAFGIDILSKSFAKKKKIKFLIMIMLTFLIVIESLTITVQPTTLEASKIYADIASNSAKTAVLETPMGMAYQPIGLGKYGSNTFYLYYQTIHQKPIYSGFEAGVSEETQRYIQTYFLNCFIWDQPAYDIIKQDMHDVGVSILNYYNIGYVVVHKRTQQGVFDIMQEHVTKSWIPQTKYLLNEIFSKAPDYEDSDLFAYQVPTSKSKTPFVVLGGGWNPLWTDYRTIGKTGSIVIINPNDTVVRADLDIEFGSFVNNTMTFLFNGNEVSDISTNAGKSYQISIPLELRPNSNTVEILMQNEIPSEIPNFEGKSHSIAVDSISLNTRSPYIETFHVSASNYTNFTNRPLTENEINELYNKILGRNVDVIGLKNWMIESTKPGHDYHWLEQQLRNSDEFKMHLKGN